MEVNNMKERFIDVLAVVGRRYKRYAVEEGQIRQGLFISQQNLLNGRKNTKKVMFDNGNGMKGYDDALIKVDSTALDGNNN